jgi:protein-tyrosine phosphatase
LFLADLRNEYGSLEKYVREIGLGDAQIASMRENLLTPG